MIYIVPLLWFKLPIIIVTLLFPRLYHLFWIMPQVYPRVSSVVALAGKSSRSWGCGEKGCEDEQNRNTPCHLWKLQPPRKSAKLAQSVSRWLRRLCNPWMPLSKNIQINSSCMLLKELTVSLVSNFPYICKLNPVAPGTVKTLPYEVGWGCCHISHLPHEIIWVEDRVSGANLPTVVCSVWAQAPSVVRPSWDLQSISDCFGDMETCTSGLIEVIL